MGNDNCGITFYEERLDGNLPCSSNDKCYNRTIPELKDLTKWERFARLKGIQKRKKPRKVWDHVANSWKPSWGRDRIDDAKNKWVLEVPDNADPYEDQFTKLTKERKERQAKNDLQRLRNISGRIRANQDPAARVPGGTQGKPLDLNRALSFASFSDASLGKHSSAFDGKKVAKKFQKRYQKRLELSNVVQPQERKKLKRAMACKKVKKCDRKARNDSTFESSSSKRRKAA